MVWTLGCQRQPVLPRWLLVMLLGGLCLAGCRQRLPPLTGQMTVTLRSAQGGAARSITEAGVLPAGHGDLFTVDARLSAPAFIYLVWLSADGKVVPLYPWNDDTLEVHDVAQPPPRRRPTHFVMCPAQSSSWTLGEQAGVETLLLLARRQPLAEGSAVAQAVADYAQPPLEVPAEPVWWTWSSAAADGQVTQARGRPDAPTAAAPPSPPVALVKRLARHFDLVHVVQFAHHAPAAAHSQAPSP